MKSKTINIKEILHFSPDGRKDVPNGSIFQKGGFFYKCLINKESFKVSNNPDTFYIDASYSDMGLSDKLFELNKKGGILVLPTEIKVLNTEKLTDLFKNKRLLPKKTDNELTSQDCNCVFAVGHFFYGTYIGENNKVYDKTSICVLINGINSRLLIKYTKQIINEFYLQATLLKDINKEKIYIAEVCEGK